jgi:hypothetical protein
MIHLDETAVLDLLDKAVAERGEEYRYVQPLVNAEIITYDVYGNLKIDTYQEFRCVYVEHSTGECRPSCLVGMVLYLAGVPLEHLDVGVNTTSTNLLNELTGLGVLTVTTEVYEIFLHAQIRQDSGDPWSVIAAGERNLTWMRLSHLLPRWMN